MGTPKKVVTNKKWCKGCGICVEFCPKNVLELKNGIIEIARPDDCISCGMCELRCPDLAIFLEEVSDEQ